MNRVLTLLLFLIPFGVYAQEVSLSTDWGENNVSEGVYTNFNTSIRYKFKDATYFGAVQLGVVSPNESMVTALNLGLAVPFDCRELDFNLTIFHLTGYHSGIFRESNLGFFIDHHREHILLEFGTHIRRFAYTEEAIEEYAIAPEDRRMTENWNLIYTGSYFLKPIGNPWNLSLSLTNKDEFLLAQETNPVFNIKADYLWSKSVKVFGEAWYKSSGALNLHADYFGYFFRVGAQWDIN